MPHIENSFFYYLKMGKFTHFSLHKVRVKYQKQNLQVSIQMFDKNVYN